MYRFGTIFLLLLTAFGILPARGASPQDSTAAASAGKSAQALLKHFYQASGGAAWQHYSEIDSEGSITAFQKTGSLRYVEDLRSGANRSAIEIAALGIKQASGNDLHQGWEQNDNGDVQLLKADDPTSIDDRYLTSHAYWQKGFGGADIALLASRQDAQTLLDGLQVRVPGGKGFTMWFAHKTGLLASVEGSVTKRFSDYHSVHGVLLPFQESKPQGNEELVIRYRTRMLLESGNEAAFAIPFHTDYQLPPSGLVTVHAEKGLEFQATINGQGPFKAVFDTAAVNYMSQGFARRLGLKLESENIEFGTSSPAKTQVHKAHVDKIQIGNLILHDQTFYVGPGPGSDDTPAAGDGGSPSLLMGYELLRRFAVRIDYARQALTFYDGAHFRYSGNGTALPIHYTGNGLIIEGAVGQASGSFLLDTGNEFGFSLSTNFVKQNSLIRKLGAHYVGYNGRGIAGPSPEAYLVRVNTLTMGPIAAPSVIAHLTTDASDTSDLAGNIGQSVLSKFTEVFDCMHAQVIFEKTPRSGKREIFNGAGLIFDTFGEGLQIMTVLPGSPGAQAGLKTGDVVSKIDGKAPPDEVNAPEFMQAPGSRLHLVVHRGPQIRNVDIVLAELL